MVYMMMHSVRQKRRRDAGKNLVVHKKDIFFNNALFLQF
ncbi:MAG: hypothetical protein BWY44_00109 [Candidatus Omnitrophica bacterium ADurb.Bin292]|nr:MAG: hypothetical protein BWY44_00109 [Candidatus Omnitrophica bacterium ADurb.Bin292]